MVSLALDSAVLAETYDRVSDRQFNHGKLLIEDLQISPGERVLDVGCGTGRLGAHVAELVGPSGEVAGVDPLPLRVELANKKRRPNFRATVGQAEDLSQFAAGSFDVVFLNSVLHWLPEKLGPLREARRVLKRGGRLGISSAAKERPHEFEGVLEGALSSLGLAGTAETLGNTTYKVTSDELKSTLLRAGFEDPALQIRTFTDHFAATDDVIAFNLASSFGNFLSNLAPEDAARVKAALEAELERRRAPEGIRLRRHLIFAVARAGA
ncbi:MULTISPECIES: class I SAM-dependent methyltransferase [Sorangium]|uniref:Methyltransferase n=1 Tax=Sorangium cellulosum TaxID=56 RepID=A0A4P2QK20_SORCE|nr:MULTISPECIES: methyltransferase domain-containing protein [Sorangium]AUX30334.1 methyltransferase [Sorangium cellulosum]WCQ89728.1 tRNA methyltransferase [Sorangium sp. Soce836]